MERSENSVTIEYLCDYPDYAGAVLSWLNEAFIHKDD